MEPESTEVSRAVPNLESGSALEDSRDVAEVSGSKPPRRKRRILRILVAALTGVGLIAWSQSLGPKTDHQLANIASAVIGVFTVVYVAFQLQLDRPECGVPATLSPHRYWDW